MSKPGYPIWWENPITIYNKYEDTLTNIVTWYKTVVTDCFWTLSGTKVTIGNVTLDSKSVLCRIPKDSRFLEKRDWVNLPDNDRKNYFTLSQGDIIVKGEVDDTIDEYVSGKRSTDLLSKYREYQMCMEIQEYKVSVGMGRNNEHYMARGK